MLIVDDFEFAHDVKLSPVRPLCDRVDRRVGVVLQLNAVVCTNDHSEGSYVLTTHVGNEEGGGKVTQLTSLQLSLKQLNPGEIYQVVSLKTIVVRSVF